MTMMRMFTPICDTCSESTDCGFHYSDDAKAFAISQGWKITSKKYTCPNCLDSRSHTMVR